jgi:hypothetical protein
MPEAAAAGSAIVPASDDGGSPVPQLEQNRWGFVTSVAQRGHAGIVAV